MKTFAHLVVEALIDAIPAEQLVRLPVDTIVSTLEGKWRDAWKEEAEEGYEEAEIEDPDEVDVTVNGDGIIYVMLSRDDREPVQVIIAPESAVDAIVDRILMCVKRRG